MKFRDRDDLEEIFSSYLKNHVFDIEKLRDHRLRGHFKDRYDFRRNLVDWDYRDWRLTGIAFETRLATGTVPNRTLGSYIEGKSVSYHFHFILV
jgi:dynein assembly factor 3